VVDSVRLEVVSDRRIPRRISRPTWSTCDRGYSVGSSSKLAASSNVTVPAAYATDVDLLPVELRLVGTVEGLGAAE
jgi:hypothetical protein